jgi:threonine dehydratase
LYLAETAQTLNFLPMVGLSEIREARISGAGRVHRTPLFQVNALGRMLNAQVFLKAEFLQKTGSFQVRGVFQKIRPPRKKPRVWSRFRRGTMQRRWPMPRPRRV